MESEKKIIKGNDNVNEKNGIVSKVSPTSLEQDTTTTPPLPPNEVNKKKSLAEILFVDSGSLRSAMISFLLVRKGSLILLVFFFLS